MRRPAVQPSPVADGTGEPAAVRPRPGPPAEAEAPQARARSGAGEVLDSLPVSLKDVFRKKVATKPEVKALLQRHGTVTAAEVAEELRQLASDLRARVEGE